MQFTPLETKLIEKLRKQDRQWPRTRWVVLVIGTLATIDVALWGYLFYLAIADFGSEHPDAVTVVGIAFLVTKCILLFLFATSCFAVAARDWNGNANRLLLLKLLDAQQKQPNV